MQRLRTAFFFLTTALVLTGCETPIGQSWNNAVSRLSSKPDNDSDTRNGLRTDPSESESRSGSGTTFLGPRSQSAVGNSSGSVPLKPFRRAARSTNPQPTPRVTLQGSPAITPRPSPNYSPKPTPRITPRVTPRPSATPSPRPTVIATETEPEVNPTPVESNEPPPFASPVPGKKGYVTSPYSPAAGFIDVTGLEPGSLAKDPYSGKVFRVP